MVIGLLCRCNNRRYYCWTVKLMLHRNWALHLSQNLLYGTNSDYLCDFAINHNMFQQVNKPTHIHGNILDLVITSDFKLITDLVVHPHTTYLLQFDHSIVTFSICAVVHHYQHREVSQLAYDFNKADLFNLSRFIALKNGDAHYYSTKLMLRQYGQDRKIFCLKPWRSIYIYIFQKSAPISTQTSVVTSEIQHLLHQCI